MHLLFFRRNRQPCRTRLWMASHSCAGARVLERAVRCDGEDHSADIHMRAAFLSACNPEYRTHGLGIFKSSTMISLAFWDDIVNMRGSSSLVVPMSKLTRQRLPSSATLRYAIRWQGEVSWETVVDDYIGIINRVLANVPAAITGMHLCRGNRGGHFHAEGGYDAVAEKTVQHARLRILSSEYEVLRFLPADKSVVLGLVSTKSEKMEMKEDVKRRIEIDRLAQPAMRFRQRCQRQSRHTRHSGAGQAPPRGGDCLGRVGRRIRKVAGKSGPPPEARMVPARGFEPLTP